LKAPKFSLEALQLLLLGIQRSNYLAHWSWILLGAILACGQTRKQGTAFRKPAILGYSCWVAWPESGGGHAKRLDSRDTW
jgi:hypothetical protein